MPECANDTTGILRSTAAKSYRANNTYLLLHTRVGRLLFGMCFNSKH